MNRLVQVFSFPTNFEFALKVPIEINIQNLSQSFDAFFKIINQAGRWQRDVPCHICVIVM